MSRYCDEGVFSLGPCRWDPAIFGAMMESPDAYVTSGPETLDAEFVAADDGEAVTVDVEPAVAEDEAYPMRIAPCIRIDEGVGSSIEDFK